MATQPINTHASDFTHLQETIRDLQWLNHLAQRLLAATNLEEALEEAVAELARHMEADGATLMLVHPERPETEITHSKQMRTLAQELSVGDEARLQQINRNVAGWMIKNKSALASEKLVHDERFPGLGLLGEINFGVIGAPICTAEKIVGTLAVFKAPTLPEAQSRSQFVEQIAAQLAPVFMKLQRMQALEEENHYFQQTFIAQHGFSGIIAKSEAMQNVFNLLQRVLPNDVRVLLEGESGTGKELIARTIHCNGPRKDKKFLALDCGAIPENLLESELFGYVKGAFTGANQSRKGLFQETHGGTLFLDEINNLPVHLQAKLLRVLQEGEVRPLGANTVEKVDVRVIAASSRALAELVQAKTFREDLYFRLKVVTLRLPPLRERTGDVPLLAQYFLEKFSKHYQRHLRGIAPEAMQALQRYHWPGNIRELEHAIEQAVVLVAPEATVIAPSDLSAEIRCNESGATIALERMSNLPAAIAALEIHMIKKALQETGGNKSQAAEKIGLSRRGLLNKLERYKILEP